MNKEVQLKLQLNIQYILRIAIKRQQMNRITVQNNIWVVDMPFNKETLSQRFRCFSVPNYPLN